MGIIKKSNSNTWMELEIELKRSIEDLVEVVHNKTSINKIIDLKGKSSVSLRSGCELFMKYVTNVFNMNDQVFTSANPVMDCFVVCFWL